MVSAFGGFLVGQAAARRMLKQGRGAILFTGASASVKGYAQSAPFAMGKFACAGLRQSMARELHPKGDPCRRISSSTAGARCRARAEKTGDRRTACSTRKRLPKAPGEPRKTSMVEPGVRSLHTLSWHVVNRAAPYGLAGTSWGSI